MCDAKGEYIDFAEVTIETSPTVVRFPTAWVSFTSSCSSEGPGVQFECTARPRGN